MKQRRARTSAARHPTGWTRTAAPARSRTRSACHCRARCASSSARTSRTPSQTGTWTAAGSACETPAERRPWAARSAARSAPHCAWSTHNANWRPGERMHNSSGVAPLVGFLSRAISSSMRLLRFRVNGGLWETLSPEMQMGALVSARTGHVPHTAPARRALHDWLVKLRHAMGVQSSRREDEGGRTGRAGCCCTPRRSRRQCWTPSPTCSPAQQEQEEDRRVRASLAPQTAQHLLRGCWSPLHPCAARTNCGFPQAFQQPIRYNT